MYRLSAGIWVCGRRRRAGRYAPTPIMEWPTGISLRCVNCSRNARWWFVGRPDSHQPEQSMFETRDTPMMEGRGDLANDPIALERAAQRAALDLQRIVVLLAQRYLGLRRGVSGHRVPAPTWHMLLDIEEQAFADLGFQGRHPAVVRDGFARLSDSRLAGSDLDAQVDWRRDDDPLPAVYAIVHGLVQDLSTDAD